MQARNRALIEALSVAVILIGGVQVGVAAGESVIAADARRGPVAQRAQARELVNERRS